MKINVLIVILLINLISCNTSQKNKKYQKSENLIGDSGQSILDSSKGYELMKQKCYICHFEKPDPLRKEEMISPPMLRIQEHYKPNYPNKDEFVNAIITFVKNPTEEVTLMPGAVKKFKLMPKLIYDNEELHLIAETIYDYDFGSAPKMRMQMMTTTLELDNGKKWILKKESMDQLNSIVDKLDNHELSDIEDYSQLGKDIFNDAKKIMLNDAYTGELFNQIHIFFFGLENNIHTLIAAKSKNEAEKQLAEIKNKIQEFYNYFE